MTEVCGYCERVHDATDFAKCRQHLVERTRVLADALESLYDWQNGPPLLSRKWLDGWNGAMAKAAELLGRKHERRES